MQWFKFNIFLILLLVVSNVYANKFSSKDCLDAEFETVMVNKAKLFGLLENRLSIKKNKCNLEISYKGILETIWKVDVCREPIHMKVTSKGNQQVYKRENRKCQASDKADYCYYRHDLIEALQDHGLIFAEGNRENLKDAHGQTFCSYLLLQRYLDDGVIFSVYEEPKNIYQEQASCELPEAQKKAESVESKDAVIIIPQEKKSFSPKALKPMVDEAESNIVDPAAKKKF
jgi:hypothetical protein